MRAEAIEDVRGGLKSSSKRGRTRPAPLPARLSAALRDTRGGMAIMGAVAVLPLCIASFAAVEFHHVTMVRSTLQSALDAATLAAAKSGKKDPAGLKSNGLPVLQSNLAEISAAKRLRAEDVNFSYLNGLVHGEARLCVKTIVGGIVGFQESCVRGASDVLREASALEVVLVLDSSGSMESISPSTGVRRIEALEAAAKGFISKLETLDDASVDDDIRIGLVPYAGTVKLDPSNRGQWWLDANGGSLVNKTLFHSLDKLMAGRSSVVQNPKRFALFDAMGIAWKGCVESRPGGYALSDDPPDAAKPDSLFVPYFAPDELDYKSVPQPIVYPNSYLSDGTDGTFPVKGQYRTLNDQEKKGIYDTYWKEIQYGVEKYTSAAVDAAGLNRNSTDHGPNRWCKTDPVVQLSKDFTALKTSLDVIPTARHTNIPMGLVWGWHVLSPQAPFANGNPYGAKGVRKILVLLTDGHSYLDPPGPMEGEHAPNKNESYYNGLGYLWRNRLGLDLGSTHDQQLAVLNSQMSTLCANMRAKGVVIFTIQLEMGITNNTQLSNCSGASNFKNANQASELESIFQNIADEISLMRLAK